MPGRKVDVVIKEVTGRVHMVMDLFCTLIVVAVTQIYP
jgi:hypothetical protein